MARMRPRRGQGFRQGTRRAQFWKCRMYAYLGQGSMADSENHSGCFKQQRMEFQNQTFSVVSLTVGQTIPNSVVYNKSPFLSSQFSDSFGFSVTRWFFRSWPDSLLSVVNCKLAEQLGIGTLIGWATYFSSFSSLA